METLLGGAIICCLMLGVFYENKWCVAATSACRLALVLLVKVEVLKPLSSSRRLDKGELPGVRSLSQYRLAGGQTASRRVASVRVDMW